MSDMKRTIAYLRVSTERQSAGNGLDEQRMAIVAYAAANNLKIDDWVVDEETGTTADRDGLRRVMFEARARRVAAVVVSRVDRLGRKLAVTEPLFEEFEQLGVRVVNVQQHIDNTPQGVAMRQMLGVFAQLDRAMMLTRLKSARAASVAKGKHGGGQSPYGYRSTGNGILAIDLREAEVVRRVFELRRENYSLAEICDILHKEGFKPRKGAAFYPTQIKRIVDREPEYRAQKPFSNIALEPGAKAQHQAILTAEGLRMHAERTTTRQQARN